MGGEARSREAGRQGASDGLTVRDTMEARNRRRGEAPDWAHRLAILILVPVKFLTAACALAGALHPEAPRYRGKAMRIRAVGYAAALGLVPAVHAARRARGPYPAGADLAVSVPMLIDAAGNTLGIYDQDRLDDVVHAVNAGVLSSLFGAVISTHMKSRRAATTATIAFGVIGELGWEGMEYLGQTIGFRGMALSEADTLGDIGSALVGTAFAAVVTWTRWRPAEGAPLADWGESSPADVSSGFAETSAGPAPGEGPLHSQLPAPPRGSEGGPRAPHRDS
jgi:hypothetical protein